MAHSAEVVISTADEVPGRTIVRTLGLVRGNSVRARHLGRDIQAGIRTIVGGRVGVYAELLETSRSEAINQMLEEARKLGANAVVAVRLTTSQIMGGAAEILAYGTAVVVE
ncbi:MAG: YbjQ family protein [Dehalococcoidia bacterium]